MNQKKYIVRASRTGQGVNGPFFKHVHGGFRTQKPINQSGRIKPLLGPWIFEGNTRDSSHTHIDTQTPTYTLTHIHTYTHTHTTYTHTHHRHIHTYTLIHVYTYTQIHTHTHTHSYTHNFIYI